MITDRIDDDVYEKIKSDVMKYHIQQTLEITCSKLADIGKNIGDLPIVKVEDIGNAAFAELIRASNDSDNQKTLDDFLQDTELFPDVPKVVLRYNEDDKREFSRMYRHAIIVAASNAKMFSDRFA